jgi:hypothetical protein
MMLEPKHRNFTGTLQTKETVKNKLISGAICIPRAFEWFCFRVILNLWQSLECNNFPILSLLLLIMMFLTFALALPFLKFINLDCLSWFLPFNLLLEKWHTPMDDDVSSSAKKFCYYMWGPFWSLAIEMVCQQTLLSFLYQCSASGSARLNSVGFHCAGCPLV